MPGDLGTDSETLCLGRTGASGQMGSSQLLRPAPPKPSRPPDHRAWAAQLAGCAWPGCGETTLGGLPAQLHSKGWGKHQQQDTPVPVLPHSTDSIPPGRRLHGISLSRSACLDAQHHQSAADRSGMLGAGSQRLDPFCSLAALHNWASPLSLVSCCGAARHTAPEESCTAMAARQDQVEEPVNTRGMQHSHHHSLCGQSRQFSCTANSVSRQQLMSMSSISEACLPSIAHQTAPDCSLSACQWTQAEDWSP